MSPRNIKILNRLMAGHSYDGVYLHRIGKRDSLNCSHCDLIDTSEHVIFHCSEQSVVRQAHDLFQQFSNLSEVLGSHNIEIFSKLARFIDDANIFELM